MRPRRGRKRGPNLSKLGRGNFGTPPQDLRFLGPIFSEFLGHLGRAEMVAVGLRLT